MWPLETARSLAVQLTCKLTDRLVQWTVGADVTTCAAQSQERQFQTRKAKGSLTTCISVVTPNRAEMKHYGGTRIQVGRRPFLDSVFHQLACWTSLQCSGNEVLPGRALHNRKVKHWKSLCQEDRYRAQYVRGDNGGYTRRNLSFWLKEIQVLW